MSGGSALVYPAPNDLTALKWMNNWLLFFNVWYCMLVVQDTTAVWGYPCSFHIDGLVQEGRISSALVMELRLSCTNPSI